MTAAVSGSWLQLLIKFAIMWLADTPENNCLVSAVYENDMLKKPLQN